MPLEIHANNIDSLNFYQNDLEVQTNKESQDVSLSNLAKEVKTSTTHAIGKRTALGDASPLRNAINSTQEFIQNKIIGPIRKHLSVRAPRPRVELTEQQMAQRVTERMHNLLYLHITPYTETRANHVAMKNVMDQKRKFMKEQMNGANISKIADQGARLPIMKRAFQELSNTYGKWGLNGIKADDKKILETQHKNLQMLSEIMESFDESQSREFSLLDPGIRSLLEPFFKGDIPLDDANVRVIVRYLQTEANLPSHNSPLERLDRSSATVKKTMLHAKTWLKAKPRQPDPYLAKVREMRALSPVTTTAIEKTGKLFEAERKGKAFMAHADKLLTRNERLIAEAKVNGEEVAHGTSVNNVRELKDPNAPDGPTVAYYKEGKGGEEATGAMEQLMWNISLIMGSDQLTATKTSSMLIQSKKGIAMPMKIWGPEEDLVDNAKIFAPKKGGIQAAQEGMTLSDYKRTTTEKPIITQETLIKGTLTTHVFGMFDAHSKNIIIDKSGNLVFFDNTRSMPNSNGVIKWNDKLISSYRSGLTVLPGSDQPLTTEDRNLLKQELSRYESKAAHLEAYLDSKTGARLLNALPPGWFEKDTALSAMQERIENLQTALDNPKVNTLNDLTMAANPDFKFFAALQFVKIASSSEGLIRIAGVAPELVQANKQAALNLAGRQSLLDLMESALKNYVDPGKVMAWCRDPELTFDDVLTNISHEIFDKKMGLSDEEQQAAVDNGDKIYEEMEDKAFLDNKDINRKHSEDFFMENFPKKIQEYFHSFMGNYPHTGRPQLELALSKQPPYIPIAWIDQSSTPPQIHLFYHTADRKTLSEPLDYLTNPGMVQIRGVDMTVSELKATFEEGASKIAEAFGLGGTQDALLSAVRDIHPSDVQALLENKPIGDYVMYRNKAEGSIEVAFVTAEGTLGVSSLLNTPEGYTFQGGKHTFPTIDAAMQHHRKTFQRRII